jgi:phage shock protein PspC (stress-responsive transcriptional regulator)
MRAADGGVDRGLGGSLARVLRIVAILLIVCGFVFLAYVALR